MGEKERASIVGLAKKLVQKDQEIERLRTVASAAAWVIADHMSGSYGAVIGPHNTPITPEQHGDGMCRVLALSLTALKPSDKIGIQDFIDDDFNRTYGLLHRNLPEDIRR